MGYMRHHGILVTTFDEKLAATAHAKATEIFGDLVTPLVEARVNGYVSFAVLPLSFAVLPDGSKEGWPDSDKGDQQRETFRDWLNTQREEDRSSCIDWVEVQYGDDEHETCIIDDSDAVYREGPPVVVDAE